MSDKTTLRFKRIDGKEISKEVEGFDPEAMTQWILEVDRFVSELYEE